MSQKPTKPNNITALELVDDSGRPFPGEVWICQYFTDSPDVFEERLIRANGIEQAIAKATELIYFRRIKSLRHQDLWQ